MKAKKSLSQKGSFFLIWGLTTLVAIICLILLQYYAMSRENRTISYNTTTDYIYRIKSMITQDTSDRKTLQCRLDEDYTSKLHVTTTIIDSRPDVDWDAENLQKLCEFVGVDEINIFDDTGCICGGSVPKYYGFSFDSGQQMAYFKPMLRNKQAIMRQSITPNTAESSLMAYFMRWNKAGTQMVQIGMNMARLNGMLGRNIVDSFLTRAAIPDGMEIIITKRDDVNIIASTYPGMIGHTLAEKNITLPEDESEIHFTVGSGKDLRDCSMLDISSYRIIASQSKEFANRNIPFTLLTFFEYQILITIAGGYTLLYLYNKIVLAQMNANHDPLTGLYNRRRYLSILEHDQWKILPDDFIFVALDINGLKKVNDTLGHRKGDELITGASECIVSSFGSFGLVFRVGGDEFVVLLRANKEQLAGIKSAFQQSQEAWSAEHKLDLFISAGYASKTDYPNKSVDELADIAEQEMYAVKAAFYSQCAHDRRLR